MSMSGKKLSIRLRAALAIFAATLLMTGTWAAAQVQEQVLLNFNGPGRRWSDGWPDLR